MAEFDPPRQSAEPDFARSPYEVIDGFLDPSRPPNSAALSFAGKIIRASYRGFGGRRDAFGVCIDLAQEVGDATSVLAEMFAANSNNLPQHWRENPEIARSVLSMAGHVELGFLRAQQIAQAHDGGNPRIDARIAEVDGFVTALQAK